MFLGNKLLFIFFGIASSHAVDLERRHLRGLKSSSDDGGNSPIPGGPVCPNPVVCYPAWNTGGDGIFICLLGEYGTWTRCAAPSDVELMDPDNYECGRCS